MKKCKIFEVKLEKDLGYAYVKLLEFRSSLGGSIYYFLEPLNLLSISQIKISSRFSWETIPPLTNYLMLNGDIKDKGKYAWKYLGDVNSQDYELYVPDLRNTRGNTALELRNDKGEWHIIRDLNDNTMQFLPYDLIKHISWGFAIIQKDMITRLTMIWMVRLGRDISKYYTHAEFEKNFWLTYYKVEAEHTVFYDTIKKESWNRLDVYPEYGKVIDMIEED